MTVWVVDTSPLIFLNHLGRLDLFLAENREVFIPNAVFEEVLAGKDKTAEVGLNCLPPPPPPPPLQENNKIRMGEMSRRRKHFEVALYIGFFLSSGESSKE